MLEMVEARRNGDKVEERHDLFSGLLDAEQDESDNGSRLSDDELIGWHSIVQHSWKASYSSF
jgi:cytochrome P450